MPGQAEAHVGAQTQPETQTHDDNTLEGLDSLIQFCRVRLDSLRADAKQKRSDVVQAFHDHHAGLISTYDAGFIVGKYQGFLEVMRDITKPRYLAQLKLAAASSVIVLQLMHKIKVKKMADDSVKVGTLLSILTNRTSDSAPELWAQQREATKDLRDFLESVEMEQIEQWRQGRGKITLEQIAIRGQAAMTFVEVCAAREEAVDRLKKIREEYGEAFLANFDEE
ncbi:hypothetical protein CLAFUW4_13294 [Fulvia fulva]|uniref:Uncharacterized protein n=1 Tax=Passalora fulva TaxID=5499 RepID=A0A9Q8PJR8_PASFU|nr:uncharacterized protein CLAFUR5_13149 [Fulvia fulva]KAK4612254.1 hypothetical protein CLAFUR4_13299 [Fulvia fulva]KAK4612462.1 hypothetical protein CLAFUR0_13304 [Fulvia fulva]UJO23707.1 hypothetical protein CLAFUR5_13149 [Fulvia fulva]WPV21492.1 hypothetical protein CLAFUW4_13294 [Fulvia fulva]WPV36460.1 hypothetical protein CLAFUW7_13301 [Fulvia fulva]